MKLILSSCFTLFFSFLFAQKAPNGKPWIQTCFQKIEVDGSNKKYMLLGDSFVLSNPHYTVNFPYVTITVKHKDSSIFKLLQLPQHKINTRIRNRYGLEIDFPYDYLFPIYEMYQWVDGQWEENKIVLPRIDGEYSINTWVVIDTLGTLKPQNLNIKVGFFQKDSTGHVPDLLSAKPANDETCYLFEPFNFADDLSLNIEGFFGSIEPFYHLSLAPHQTEKAGWTKDNKVKTKKNNSFPKLDSNYCEPEFQWTTPHHAPDPVPGGCIDFDLEYTIEACFNPPRKVRPCLPLKAKKTIAICCDCDVRAKAPAD